jgi:four helix bundle protein
MKPHKFRDLLIWRKSIEIAKDVYLLFSLFPKEERFGLIDQLRRSSVSISSNISEGAGRNSKNEFNHFLGIANGSANEVISQLYLSVELNILKNIDIEPIIDKLEEVQKMIYKFKQSVLEIKN